MDELQTLIKLVLLHNTCCHAKLEAHRDKAKWIKESSSQLLPSQRHDSGSGRKCSGEQCWGGPARSSPETRRGGGGDGKAVAGHSDRPPTPLPRRGKMSSNTRRWERCRGVFTMMNIRGMNVMVMSEGTVSQGLAVMCGRPARLTKAMEARQATRVAAPARPTSGTAPHEEP